ncbi:MAG: CHASE2 domain-containing protein [Cyanobacteria bacterium P01_D01_bin.156]
MSSCVILKLGEGNCDVGLSNITAQLFSEGGASKMQCTGGLPSAPDIPLLYQRWQKLYLALQGIPRFRHSANTFEFDETEPTNVSAPALLSLEKQLQKRLNQWLNASEFRNIDQQLRTKLDTDENIRFIIETEDPLLQKIPWHLWCFIEHYQKAEIAISARSYQQVPTSRIRQQMRILVVLGYGDGLDLQPDRFFLESSAADTVVLQQPMRSELDAYLHDAVGWDIFFFAGHSTSHAVDAMGEMREQLSLNAHEKLSIAELRFAFKDAIEKGLKLAIFNSCDGLGLARELVGLNLPQLIAMREPVVDEVAQTFLKKFLQSFSQGEAFYSSVRVARQNLQGLESDFPGASWLPVIYQNPTAGLFNWRNPKQPVKFQRFLRQPGNFDTAKPEDVDLRRLILPIALVMVLILTGLRSFGLLQPLELSAYDALVRARPVGWDSSLPVDDRLLLVEITADDTDEYGYPIDDDQLATALTKLRRHDPAAIGVDLHRYQSNGEGRDQLLKQFDDFPDLVTVCSFGLGDRDILGHPPEFSPEQSQEQVGFSDLETDGTFQPGKSVVRRQLLSYDAKLDDQSSDCVTSYSLSLNLALRFLLRQGVEPLHANDSGQWVLGDVKLKRLAAQTAAYQNLDGQSNQLLLNYRFKPRPAIRMSFGDVLADKFADDDIRDRIVLIGVVDPLGNDYRETPFGELPGVWVHAHGVSHILSAVLNKRRLIWVLPQWGRVQWGDMLWMWSWALLGGVLVWGLSAFRVFPLLALALLLAGWALYWLCLVILVKGGWVPFVPALLALLGTAGVLLARKYGFLRLEGLLKLLSIKRYP